MRMKFFTLSVFDSGTTEQELNRFLAAHRILGIDRQFVQDGADSHWCLCVSYQETASSVAPGKARGKIDYKELLSETDFVLYSRLRELRKHLAEKEGVPVYALFSNEQLATMVQQQVSSRAQLQAIEGVGAGRIEKYGQHFLALLEQTRVQQPNMTGSKRET